MSNVTKFIYQCDGLKGKEMNDANSLPFTMMDYIWIKASFTKIIQWAGLDINNHTSLGKSISN